MTVRAMQAGLRIAEVPSLELPRRSGSRTCTPSATASASCEPCCATTARCFRAPLPGARTRCRATARLSGGGDT